MARTLYLLRHGETRANGRYVGTTDLEVTEAGLAALADSSLREVVAEIDQVLCSPMLRCRQTAEVLGLEPVIVEELREIDFGRWENRTFAEIARDWPEKVAEWCHWSEGFTFPEGENIGHFIKRIQAVAKMVEEATASRILLVSHGGVVRHLLCHFLRIPPENYLLFDVRPGCWSTVELHSGGGVLTALNYK